MVLSRTLSSTFTRSRKVTWQLIGEIATTVISVITALGLINGLAYAISILTMRKEFFPILEKERARFKAFVDDLYEQELLRSRIAAERLTELQSSQERLVIEFKEFRSAFERHEITLSSLPAVLVSLNDTLSRHARTDDEMKGYLRELSIELKETRLQVARIEAKVMEV